MYNIFFKYQLHSYPGKQNLHEDVLKTSWRGVDLVGFILLERIGFFSVSQVRNKLLPELPVKKFDDRPARDLMHDEIFSLKREKILSGYLTFYHIL